MRNNNKCENCDEPATETIEFQVAGQNYLYELCIICYDKLLREGEL